VDNKIKELLAKLLSASTDADRLEVQAEITAEFKDLNSKAGKYDSEVRESQKQRKRAQAAEGNLKKIAEKLAIEIPDEKSERDLEDILDEHLEKTTGKASESDRTVKQLQKDLDKTARELQEIKATAAADKLSLYKKDRDIAVADALKKAGINQRFDRFAVRDITDKATLDEETGEWSYDGKSLDEAVTGYKKDQADFFGAELKPGNGTSPPSGGKQPFNLGKSIMEGEI